MRKHNPSTPRSTSSPRRLAPLQLERQVAGGASMDPLPIWKASMDPLPKC